MIASTVSHCLVLQKLRGGDMSVVSTRAPTSSRRRNSLRKRSSGSRS